MSRTSSAVSISRPLDKELVIMARRRGRVPQLIRQLCGEPACRNSKPLFTPSCAQLSATRPPSSRPRAHLGQLADDACDGAKWLSDNAVQLVQLFQFEHSLGTAQSITRSPNMPNTCALQHFSINSHTIPTPPTNRPTLPPFLKSPPPQTTTTTQLPNSARHSCTALRLAVRGRGSQLKSASVDVGGRASRCSGHSLVPSAPFFGSRELGFPIGLPRAAAVLVAQ
jgi:hypothetical protein